jgi:hypothetical protein
VGTGKAVMKLLEDWEKLKLTDNMASETIATFSRLAKGEAFVEENSEEKWIPAQPGQLTVGDEVRVLADAFDGKLAAVHNGRRGRIVAIRYGDVIMKTTDDKEPVLDGAHYSPYKLEKRVA